MCYSFVYVGVFWADVFYGWWGGGYVLNGFPVDRDTVNMFF